MGLDVKLYKSVREVRRSSKNFDFIAFNYDEFKDNAKNLTFKGKYRANERIWPISYPYGMHMRFREELCKLTGRPAGDWKENHNPENPFHELLFFADNEGTIDWETSRELYKDFENYKRKASEHESAEFRQYYEAWHGLFDKARKTGNVIIFS